MSGQVKYCIIFLICLLSVSEGYANAIDSIKSSKDVIAFIKSNIIRRPKELFFSPFDKYSLDSSDVNTGAFYKTDIDGNGKTDIIISGGRTIVMDEGRRYIAHTIDINGAFWYINYFFEQEIQLPDLTTALLYRHETEKWEEGTGYKAITIHDTLVFKFDHFVEYRRPQVRPEIKKIIFRDYESDVEISRDGAAIYHHHPDGVKDSVAVLFYMLDRNSIEEIWQVLTFLDMASLNDNYSVNSRHEGTAMLNVYFEDGTVKKINDYAFGGTLGLRLIYSKIYDLQRSPHWQKWQDVNPKADSYLIQCPIAFTDWWGGETYKATVLDNSAAGKSYIGVRPYCGDIYTNITLFPDHRFLLMSPKQNRCHIENILSLGDWHEVGDSVVVLNWDGISTFAAARDKEKCKKHFNNDKLPRPARIDNLRFSYSNGKSNLKLLREKKYESTFREN